MTGVVASVLPSPATLNVTVPAPPVSSSTPTCAVNLVHLPAREISPSLGEFVPRPFANATWLIVIGFPSPAACSPLLVSRSTGPHPLVADRNGRSLTRSVPARG